MTSKLLGLRAEQFKRLQLVDLAFDDATGTYALMGENEAGKSSLLDALESVLAGRKAPKFARPIHNDGDEARIIATFDDIVITRIFKKGKPPTIEIRGTDGRKFANTEEITKALFEHVALDPLAFSRLKDEEQVATLLPLIGYNPAKDDADHAEAYSKRTQKGRDRDSAKARVDAIPLPPAGLPDQLISAATLSDDLAVALGKNNERERLIRDADELESRVEAIYNRITALRRQLEEQEASLDATRAGYLAARAAAEAAETVDTQPIRDAIMNAEVTNSAINRRNERGVLAAVHNQLVGEYGDLTAEIEAIAQRKKTALAEAKMPVPRLTIDPESMLLMLNGQPFSQASTGVKIRTGVAIAMALNPDLRLIMIRDASLLDQSNRNVIDELAKANDFLVLMEIADENSPVGVIIEQGEVREVRA